MEEKLQFLVEEEEFWVEEEEEKVAMPQILPQLQLFSAPSENFAATIQKLCCSYIYNIFRRCVWIRFKCNYIQMSLHCS